jgi:hypothetical protein
MSLCFDDYDYENFPSVGVMESTWIPVILPMAQY